MLLLVAGCATYHPQPISPEQTAAAFDARSLTAAGLCAFLETNQVAVPGPQAAWNLKQLTLVAFYYQPALAEARAQLLAAQAATITAGERPNPSVTVTPGYDSQIPDTPSPWIVPVSFDLPIETAGKRGKRIAEAEHLAEAARWDLVGTVWQTRSQVRAALLNLYAARETGALLARQETAQNNMVRLLEGQLAAGAVSSYEVAQARTALATTQLARQDAVGKFRQARVELAHVLGVPTRALDGVAFSFATLNRFPRDLTRPETRRQALLNRADVRGALAGYAASQSALQLEIANQYPDLHLGPGYAWNSGSAGDNQWELGVTLTLPLLNHNEGPVAEAMAKRAQAAAHFLTVQANAVAEIDSALAGYRAALQQVATAKTLLDNSQKQLDSIRAQAQVGEVDPLAVANAEVEFAAGAQNRLNALVQAQQSLGQLEDAVQSPLTLPPATLDTAQNISAQTEK
ncbi:MAG TPA: TolC family protein [Verrucomicrobiae bacterium]|nr:TolC family protein [Verrucomicrobiae bacterium]